MLRWDLGAALGAPDRLAGDRRRAEATSTRAQFLGALPARWPPRSASRGERWRAAYAARRARRRTRFDAALPRARARARSSSAREHGVVPVVVLGRTYTIYNTVLNSNVPAILREQGAIAIPVDCYPVGRRRADLRRHVLGLRPAHPARRPPDPAHARASTASSAATTPAARTASPSTSTPTSWRASPSPIIETDGHSGDAGTKTRVEAFLHCVREDLRRAAARRAAERPRSASSVDEPDARRDPATRGERVLIPRMGAGGRGARRRACAASGCRAEALPDARPRDAAPRPAPHLGQGVPADDASRWAASSSGSSASRRRRRALRLLHAQRRRPLPLRRLQRAAPASCSSGSAGRTGCGIWSPPFGELLRGRAGRRSARWCFTGLHRRRTCSATRSTTCARSSRGTAPREEIHRAVPRRAARRSLEREAGRATSPAAACSCEAATGPALRRARAARRRRGASCAAVQRQARGADASSWSARSTCAATRSRTTS